MSTEHTAFSTSGEDAITRTIDVEVDTTADRLPPTEFDNLYEIERTSAEIVSGDYKRIALQFPDQLLHDSVPIYRKLKSRIGVGRELYVLADTSYGSCCVDEVAAQHVDADAMVHYGHACMTQTSRLPVIYVFGRRPIDIERCTTSVMEFMIAHLSDASSTRPDTILLRHDVVYSHQADKLCNRFEQAFKPLGISITYTAVPTTSHPKPSTPSQPVEPPAPSTAAPSSPSQTVSVLYIGGESLGLTNLLMTNGLSDVFSYDPTAHITRLESTRTNKLLMRRYAAVQKARDADVFGILVGTLGVASYLPLIKHLRKLLTRAHKKSYTISVGKLNPSKLANFLEIECFVLVACPENSVIESKEFLRPIVTPFELEVALRSEQSWTGRYVLDFERLLVDGADSKPESNGPRGEGDEEEEDSDRPVFSLITGTYRHAKRYGETTLPMLESDSAAMILRNQDSSVARLSDSAAGQFLQTRTYQGLETRVGEDAPSVLEQGRSGIARGYQDDHS
ncbi:Diphthamide biosynthesis protein 2 [Hypsizygus marmoreus]|uniref:2-(3-amino-3-carboxypropyl)histidine synthase subunit 2 n=1 Tax=Hypsizygus marmoreus TaxID=39966 RepID=A0A369JN95_HYPMA|nr:Diphthamide biosynthesis protein 2 [Hypsizygus marmoreus]